LSLEELGLKADQLRVLRDAGFNTLESICAATIAELENVKGISGETANKIWRKAQETLIPQQYVPASKLMLEREKNIQQLTTGSKALNELLGGGVETGSITELAGEYGVGKSQICHQLSVNVFLTKEKGGFATENETCGVLYIDTEKTFRAKRTAQMAEAQGLDVKHVLNHIIISHAYSSDHQIFLLDHADAVIKENNVRLIIIDSILAHFRAEYLGRELLAARQQQLNRHMRKLSRLARAFNCAAVITNQAIASPTFYGTSQPTGGNIVAHGSTTRLWIRRPKVLESVRIARLLESPWLPTGEATFRITEKGVEDTVE